MRPLTWLLAAPRVVRAGASRCPKGRCSSSPTTSPPTTGRSSSTRCPGRIGAGWRRPCWARCSRTSGTGAIPMAAGTQGLLYPRAAGLLAGDGALQCVSAAAPARLPAQLCPRRQGPGPRLQRAGLSRGNALGRGQLAHFRPGIGLLAKQSYVPVLAGGHARAGRD